jgi:hypothetical protein
MKAIIYAGIGLFSVATAYGIVDYYGNQKSGVIKKLYAEEEKPALPEATETSTTIIPIKVSEPVPVENKTATVKSIKKAKKVSKKIRFENFSRAKLPQEVVAEQVYEEKTIPEKIIVTQVDAQKKETATEKKIAKKDQ